MLVLTQYVAKHEFEPLRRVLDVDDLIFGAGKVLKGLAVELRSSNKLQGCRFFKVRIGKRNSVRMIVFVVTETQKVVPVLIRLKKDKIFGMNMSMNNPDVVGQVDKNLGKILDDIENKRYQEFGVLSS